MKKTLVALASILLLAGCSSTVKLEEETKTGLGVVTTTKIADAGEKDGSAQVDTVIAAVTVDKNGKIVGVQIDTAQTKTGFTADGKAIDAKITQSKKQLGNAYNMKAASSIGKEWFEQIEALEAFMVGKTADEINAIAVDEKGVPTEADLTSSVTIKINGYKEAVTQAIENAK